jgi:hypothetical protein
MSDDQNPDSIIETPYARSTAVVRPEYIDSNGHMNVGYYHVIFDIASDPFFEYIGLVPEIRRRYASSTFALESHLFFHREVKAGDRLRFEARLLHADENAVGLAGACGLGVMRRADRRRDGWAGADAVGFLQEAFVGWVAAVSTGRRREDGRRIVSTASQGRLTATPGKIRYRQPSLSTDSFLVSLLAMRAPSATRM